MQASEEKAVVLNEKDAARYICMSRPYLRKCRCEGNVGNRTPGPPYVKLGRAVRYRVADLDEWLLANRRG